MPELLEAVGSVFPRVSLTSTFSTARCDAPVATPISACGTSSHHSAIWRGSFEASLKPSGTSRPSGALRSGPGCHLHGKTHQPYFSG